MNLAPGINYTAQDVLGSLLGFGLFFLVFVPPGYVVGHALDLLEFRSRRRIVRYVFALVFSNAVAPILLFLAYRLGSGRAGLILLGVFAIAWAVIEGRALLREASAPQPGLSPALRRYQRIALVIGAGWVIFSILLLVDMQVGDRLYFNTNAYDFTTRASIVDAITRTGVPPVSPGYYSGEPDYINQLYYFWYILASGVDALGGQLVTARHAMIASVAWCGLVLMATLAAYLRHRGARGGLTAWRRPLGAWLLLLISGLDIFPVALLLVVVRLAWGYAPFRGHLEGWNTPVTSWLNVVTWLPLHVASALACLTGLLVMLAAFGGRRRQKTIATFFSGLAFASAFGLSVWVTLVFSISWGAWAALMLGSRKQRGQVPYLVGAGLVAVVAAAPFIVPLFQPGEGTGQPALELVVRPFLLVQFLDLPSRARNLANLLFLPLNYFMELGFFLVVAVLWIRKRFREGWHENRFFVPEALLVATTFVVLSLFRSSVIGANDLGMRGWLPAQFVLVVWAGDLLSGHLARSPLLSPAMIRLSFPPPRTGSLIALMFIMGMLMTGLEALSGRIWSPLVDAGVVGFPNDVSSDRNLGERTYNARQAYDYIRENIPPGIIIQSNPLVSLDRPGGLYGDHQMAAADRAAYGVSRAAFTSLATRIQPIFTSRFLTWQGIDRICNTQRIGIIVLNDQDARWQSLNTLLRERPALYANDYYAVFACGDYAWQPTLGPNEPD